MRHGGHFFTGVWIGAALLLALCLSLPVVAQDAPDTPEAAQAKPTLVPDNWRGSVRRQKPDLKGIEKLRFITDGDFPPFDYFDEDGSLTGFNVDLARAICEVLAIECEIKPGDWDTLFSALDKNEADAAIASLRISKENLAKADFTERYYQTPARFIARNENPARDLRPEALADRKIGVAEGTAHEAYLKTFFPQSEIVPFVSVEAARDAVKAGKVDLAFGDGIALMFWLNGTISEGCCQFRGGPYTDGRYFGEGIGIAVKHGSRQLKDVLNYALDQVHASGRYEELFLRYFPMSFL